MFFALGQYEPTVMLSESETFVKGRKAMGRRWQTLRFSIANSQQVLPLPKVALECDALGELKGRDQASLDGELQQPVVQKRYAFFGGST